MKVKPRRPAPQVPEPAPPAPAEMRPSGFVPAALALFVGLTAILVPLWVSRTTVDAFRLPKQMLFQSLAALLFALLLIGALYHGRAFFEPLWRDRKLLLLLTGIVAWTLVTTLTSTNRPLSILTVAWVLSCVVYLVATFLVAHRSNGLLLAGLVLFMALLNGGLAMLQRGGVYNPMTFRRHMPLRNQATALIGNPNDVGTYLLFPAIVALALALTSRKHVRFAASVAFVVAFAGMIASDTLTAVVAFMPALGVMLLLRSKKTLVPLLALTVAATLLVAAYAPLRTRVLTIADHLRAGRWVELSSLRLPAFYAAWEMFADHPITGVGPGCFAYWYLPYKMELNKTHPRFYLTGENFGETHNDHLQTLAVSGLPGYVLLLSATGLLASGSLRRRRPELEATGNRVEAPLADRPELSRVASLPLAVAFAVVALAQFPLEMAASAQVLLHLAAVCYAWRRPA
ncbi:MAG TPA: O-antigen ligase family protein [Thermoanaerobaculia bacterium]|jgi:O-antigen ligase